MLVREPDQLGVERAHPQLAFGARVVELAEANRHVAVDDDRTPTRLDDDKVQVRVDDHVDAGEVEGLLARWKEAGIEVGHASFQRKPSCKPACGGRAYKAV